MLNKLSTSLWIVALCAIFSSTPFLIRRIHAAGPLAPVEATITETVNGKTETGTWARTSDGSEAKWLHDSAGNPTSTLIIDLTKGTATTIHHAHKQYILAAAHNTQSLALANRPLPTNPEQEVVNGVATFVVHSQDGMSTQWISWDYHLVMREEIHTAHFEITRELSNVQFHTPDPKLFTPNLTGLTQAVAGGRGFGKR